MNIRRQFLIQTHKGVYVLMAKDWNEACEFARLSGCVDADKGITLLGAFADEVRYASQLMHTGLVCTTPDLLKKAIEMYAAACVADSWKGGGDPESIPDIEENLKEARSLLKDLTGFEPLENPCSSTSVTPP